MAAGKSSVANLLISEYGFSRISSGEFLRGLAIARGLDVDRSSLQSLGDHLDLDTDFAWLVDEVAVPAMGRGCGTNWLVDAVRKRRQVYHFRRRFNAVTHVHISAPEHLLMQRYIERLLGTGADEDAARREYSRATLHPNEIEARSLSDVADLHFDTSKMSPGEIAVAIGGDSEESGSS